MNQWTIFTFADPYPGEIDFSIIARSCEWESLPKNYMCAQEYLGAINARAVVGFQSQIPYLLTHLHPYTAYTVEEWVENYTLLPLFKPFLPPSRYQELYLCLISEDTELLPVLLGQISSGIPDHEFLMVCPLCEEEDYECFGERYFHRLHQAAGILVCPKHKTFLVKTVVSRKDLRSFISAESVFEDIPPTFIDEANEEHLRLLFIAEEMNTLLNLGKVPHHYNDLRRRYQIALYFADLATYRGNIRIKHLTQEFKKSYSNEFLTRLGCEIEGKHQRNWVARIGQKGAIQHPLRHLLILSLISKPIRDFLSFKLEIRPFPNEPYPCLNKICPFFHEDVIEDIRLGISRRQGRSPMGTFRCHHCDFTYCRVGPDESVERRFRGKTLRYGWLWDQTLRELWDTKLLRTEIADCLNVEYDTMIRQVKRLQLQYPTEEVNSPESISQISYREQWLSVLEENSGKGAAILAEMYPRLYSSLERFDLNWLEAHLPDERSSKALQKVDWKARDLKLYPQVADAAELIKQQRNPPRRISANSIGIALGYKNGAIHKELPKLANTKREILKYSESLEEFAIRRIHLVAFDLQEVPTVAQMIKLAGLSKSIQSEKVLITVHTVIEKLQHLLGDESK